MFTLNGNPISIDRPYTAPDGTKYANLRDPAIRAASDKNEEAITACTSVDALAVVQLNWPAE